MCGIIGLLVKNPSLRASLGELMVPMLIGMAERGPDSAGLAVFTEPVAEGDRKYSLYSGNTAIDWMKLTEALQTHLIPFHLLHATNQDPPAYGTPLNKGGRGDQAKDFEIGVNGTTQIKPNGNHAVLTANLPSDIVKQWLKQHYPTIHILSVGHAIDLYKDAGPPSEIASRYNFRSLQGTHVVAHTRMATESAVTPAHAHPFTAGEDFCLVHNGSLSNPYSIRRQLEPRGIHFETDNDTEAACRFLEWRMREGDELETALQKGFEELDGFYTLLMGTSDKLALVRDAFACKPAVVAETEEYVAIASEFRSLSHLPDVKNAHIYEPAPEELYVWSI